MGTTERFTKRVQETPGTPLVGVRFLLTPRTHALVYWRFSTVPGVNPSPQTHGPPNVLVRGWGDSSTTPVGVRRLFLYRRVPFSEPGPLYQYYFDPKLRSTGFSVERGCSPERYVYYNRVVPGYPWGVCRNVPFLTTQGNSYSLDFETLHSVV